MMLFSKEPLKASSTVCPVETVIRHVGEGLTLISTLMRNDTASHSFFSIAVSLFAPDTGRNDARMIENVTTDGKTAEELFRRITEGTVTPCTLSDVLEDLL